MLCSNYQRVKGKALLLGKTYGVVLSCFCSGRTELVVQGSTIEKDKIDLLVISLPIFNTDRLFSLGVCTNIYTLYSRTRCTNVFKICAYRFSIICFDRTALSESLPV